MQNSVNKIAATVLAQLITLNEKISLIDEKCLLNDNEKNVIIEAIEEIDFLEDIARVLFDQEQIEDSIQSEIADYIDEIYDIVNSHNS